MGYLLRSGRLFEYDPGHRHLSAGCVCGVPDSKPISWRAAKGHLFDCGWPGGRRPWMGMEFAISRREEDLDFFLRARGRRLQRNAPRPVLSHCRCLELSEMVPALCLDRDEFDYNLPREK